MEYFEKMFKGLLRKKYTRQQVIKAGLWATAVVGWSAVFSRLAAFAQPENSAGRPAKGSRGMRPAVARETRIGQPERHRRSRGMSGCRGAACCLIKPTRLDRPRDMRRIPSRVCGMIILHKRAKLVNISHTCNERGVFA